MGNAWLGDDSWIGAGANRTALHDGFTVHNHVVASGLAAGIVVVNRFAAVMDVAASAAAVASAVSASTAVTTTAAAASVVAFVTPQAFHAGEHTSAFPAGLAVEVPAAITWIAAIGGLVDPRINVEFAATAARATAITARCPAGSRPIGSGSTTAGMPHRATATAGEQSNPQEEERSEKRQRTSSLVHRGHPCHSGEDFWSSKRACNDPNGRSTPYEPIPHRCYRPRNRQTSPNLTNPSNR